MKALELLKADRDYCLAMNNYKSIINLYDKAIKELEDLQNRNCKNCKYWKTKINNSYGICNEMRLDISRDGIELDNVETYLNFCCNKWESK